MRLNNQQIINLPVQTVSGQNLGYITDFVIDTSTHKIIQYLVKPSNLVQRVTGEKMIIHFEQVVDLNKDKMVVEDNTVYAKGINKSKKVAPMSV